MRWIFAGAVCAGMMAASVGAQTPAAAPLVEGKRGQRWIVRDYFEPVGRSAARYNFERFSPDGKVLAYVSLESANAFRDELKGGDVVVGPAGKSGGAEGFALDWYDGKAHGTIARY